MRTTKETPNITIIHIYNNVVECTSILPSIKNCEHEKFEAKKVLGFSRMCTPSW